MAITAQRGGGCGRGTSPSHRCVKLISLLTVRFTVSHASMLYNSDFGGRGGGGVGGEGGGITATPPPLHEALTNDEK